jgi:hypothetical protein
VHLINIDLIYSRHGWSGHMSQFTVDDLHKTIDSCLGGDGAALVTDATVDTELDDLHISITDEEIDELRTPRAVIDFINRRLAEAA